MRKIRIKNENFVENLVKVITEEHKNDTCFISNETYEMLIGESVGKGLIFIKQYDGYTIETVMDVRRFCDSFYVIENIASNGFELYSRPEQRGMRYNVVIGAE